MRSRLRPSRARALRGACARAALALGVLLAAAGCSEGRGSGAGEASGASGAAAPAARTAGSESGSAAAAGGGAGAAGAPVADTLYVGGPIVTMDAEGHVAEALAVGEGRILAVGTRAALQGLRGPATQVVELAGRAVLPGFIDAHGHLSQAALLSAAVNLAPPPVGAVRKIEEIQLALRDKLQTTPPRPGAWLVGAGYDDSLLEERRHPTRAELDAVTTEFPVLVLHASLHLAVANSPALALAGIGKSTPDPPGGVIRRDPGTGEPTGVLEESAFWRVLAAMPTPPLADRLALLDRAQQHYAAAGITTAQDGATRAQDWKLLRAAADAGRLFLDVVAYPVFTDLDAVATSEVEPRVYRGHLALGGMKLVLDGSPQGKTAWLTKPYLVPPPGRKAGYRGYPALPDDVVAAQVERARDRGLQLLAHCNGDAAADQWLAALEAAGYRAGDDRRPVMIHAQTVRDDQLDRMKTLGVIPSFFVSHVFYWGDWHQSSVLGPARAARISPAASAAARGLRMTFHDDAPVVPPNPLRLVWSAVNRTTRSGQVLGPDQRISVARALRAVTLDAAYQYFEEPRKGSLEPGKLADLVILSESPLTADPAQLDQLRVLETVKEGRTIWRSRSEEAPDEPNAPAAPGR